MKKLNLEKLNLEPSDLLESKQLKTVLGGSSCILLCSNGATYPTASDCLQVASHICYHSGGPGTYPVSCTCS